MKTNIMRLMESFPEDIDGVLITSSPNQHYFMNYSSSRERASGDTEGWLFLYRFPVYRSGKKQSEKLRCLYKIFMAADISYDCF